MIWKVLAWLSSIITGSGGHAHQAREAYRDKLAAQNDADRLAADERAEKLAAAVEMARISSGAPFWSATSLGRWLIVVPYRLWWASIYAVSIINGLFETGFVVLDVPKHINDMAVILVPAIVIADAGAFVGSRFARR